MLDKVDMGECSISPALGTGSSWLREALRDRLAPKDESELSWNGFEGMESVVGVETE